MRNHNTLTRDKLIPELAKCVPEGHTVSLDNPELFVLVEIFKVCSSWIEIPFVSLTSSLVERVRDQCSERLLQAPEVQCDGNRQREESPG